MFFRGFQFYCFCDLDLKPITLTLKVDLVFEDTQTKNEVNSIHKSQPEQTDRYSTENYVVL